MKFTFKKHIKTGPYASFGRDYTDIKLQRKVVGYISEIDYDKYHISFAIVKRVTEKDPAPFKWIKINKIFRNENKAREYVTLHDKAIMEKFNLYQFEDFN